MKALVAVALVLTPMPLVAAAAADNQEQSSETPKQERQICRRIDVASETRVSRRRVCMTAAQWRARSDSSTDDAEDQFSVIGRETLETPGRTTIPQ